jgi:hypothetical protein
MTKPIDADLQAQVDAQLIEQGAFAPLELLFNSGRLIYADYESWRREEIDLLDGVLMGNKEKVRGEIEQAVGYARSIGLVEQPVEFHSWQPQGSGGKDKQLRISADAQLRRLIGSRYLPARDVPQLDLFFDNPVVALCNGIARALSARNAAEAQRQLDRLYALAPNHQDLAAFDLLLAALGHLSQAVDDPAQETEFIFKLTPIAKRVLGAQSRDLLSPLWRQVAESLHGVAFSPERPLLHSSLALYQAQEWAAVQDSVLSESDWWLHAELCVRAAASGFHRRHRVEALAAWFHLCWHAPQRAEAAVEEIRQPELTASWRRFVDGDQESDDAAELTAMDFPAWLLLDEPGLAQQLALDLPKAQTLGAQSYRCIHSWIHARRAKNRDQEMALRKTLQAAHPALFSLLKRVVGSAP